MAKLSRDSDFLINIARSIAHEIYDHLRFKNAPALDELEYVRQAREKINEAGAEEEFNLFVASIMESVTKARKNICRLQEQRKAEIHPSHHGERREASQ